MGPGTLFFEERKTQSVKAKVLGGAPGDLTWGFLFVPLN
jgi:hypothetical protein